MTNEITNQRHDMFSSLTQRGFICQSNGFRLAVSAIMCVCCMPQGKGEMNTFWLLGKDDFKKPLPDFQKLFAADKQTAMPLPMTSGRTVRKTLDVFRPSLESQHSGALSVSQTDVKHGVTSNTAESSTANTANYNHDNRTVTSLSDNELQNDTNSEKTALPEVQIK